METNLSRTDDRFAEASAELVTLRRFPGTPKEFWPRLLAACAQLAQADAATLLLGKPEGTPRWTKIGEWTAGKGSARLRANFSASLEQAAERALAEVSFIQEDETETGPFTVGLRLKTQRPEDQLVLVAQVLDTPNAEAREGLVRLVLAADTPSLYQANLNSRQTQADVEKFAAVLDLMVPVNAEHRFLAAALALCNGVSTRLVCDRVSLGWMEGGYARLKAMSRTEKFDRQMEAAQLLEGAMEEGADQDEEVIFPAPAGSTAVTRDHEKYAKEQSIANLATVPLREGNKVVAVLACERSAAPFSATEMQQLRLLGDQVTPRLASLKKSDRWFGARLAAGFRESAAKVLGPDRTWMKVFAILGVLLVAALFLIRVPYRVEGTFILRAEGVGYVTAPFDGYIEKVNARPGDHLAKDAEIVSLNRAELLLEQSNAAADLGRYEREMEKSRANKQLAEMRIAEALMTQSRAKLALIAHRIDAAVLKSPFEGVIVEGDLRERISSPVKTGEALYKVARLDGLYIEAEVNERDVREILNSKHAEFAFVSQPKQSFGATVMAIEPAALAKKDLNVFLVRLKPDAAPESWWRPGMTGLCKISVENRSLWWIFTHRTADFLRMKLWW